MTFEINRGTHQRFRMKHEGGACLRTLLNAKLLRALITEYSETFDSETFYRILAVEHFVAHDEIIDPQKARRNFMKEWDRELAEDEVS